MAIPEGYTPLAKIGINYKGDYVDGATYSQLDAVFYAGSTYLAVIDDPVGVPNNDGQNWRYLAQGAGEEINKLLGNTDISQIGDGTVTGAIAYLKENGGGQIPEMIETYADIMANTVEGYAVDALAVKEGFENVNMRYNKETDKVQIYYNGEWVDWKSAGLQWDGYLYNTGNEYTDITGGFEALGLCHVGFENPVLTPPTLFRNSTNMQIKQTSGRGSVWSVDLIDVTDFTTLSMTLENTTASSAFYLGFLADKETDFPIADMKGFWNNSGAFSKAEYTLDISELSGEMYFCIDTCGMNANDVLTIYEIKVS